MLLPGMLLARTPRGGNTARFEKKKDAFFTFDLFVILFFGRGRRRGGSLLVGSVSWRRSPLKNSYMTYFVTRSILS